MPLDFFSDGEIKENVRFQRRIPPQQQQQSAPISTPANSYLASNGVPLYKYRQKYPQGYSGRRKRHAPRLKIICFSYRPNSPGPLTDL